MTLTIHSRRLRLLLAAMLSLGPSGLLAQPVERRVPTAALIDQEGGVVAALLEAKLLEASGAEWLERNEINRILEEQKIDAAFGAAGGKERLSLGKLLKADLLVLIRRIRSPEEKELELLECVVCETKQGLRLRMAYALSGKEEQSAVIAFSDAFDAAVRKYRQTVREIVAVPPLVSENLSFDHNYLQPAYARLIEQSLLDQPGVIVVELGEAQAIAREVAIGADDRRVRRDRLPLYLLGSFRHSGTGEKTRVSVKMRLKRGEKELGQQSQKELLPQQVGTWLANASLELLQQTRTVAVAKAEPKSEARQLAQRAKEFFRIGNWEESVALMEASLLLEPNQQELCHDAVVACGELIPRSMRYGELRKERVAAAVALYRRGLEHLEAFARTAGAMENYREAGQTDFVAAFEAGTNGWNLHPDTPADVRVIITEMLPIRRDTYLRIARFRFAAGFQDEFWLGRAVRCLPPTEQLALTAQLLEEFRNRPDLQQFGVHLALHVGERGSPEYEQFLNGLSRSRFEQLRAVAENTRRRLARMESDWKERENARAPEVTDVAKEIIPTPISLTLAGETIVAAAHKPSGCVPAGDGRDVFFGYGVLYVMQKRGELQVLWRSKEPNCWPRSVVYDGRYLWASFARHRRSPALLVVDLESGEVTQFAQEDGLPGDDLEHEVGAPVEVVQIGPLHPGQVCLAGSLGRAWIGIATFDGAGKSLRIIHEAREAANNADLKQGQSTAVAFQPTLAMTLSDRDAHGKLVQKALFSRLTRNLAARELPLLVDIASEQVSVASFPMWAREEEDDTFATIVDGKLLFAAFNGKLRAPELLTVSATDGKAEVVYEDPPDGFYAAQGTELHILGKQWWLFDTKTRELRVAGSPCPWLFDNRWARKDIVVPSTKRGTDDLRLRRVYASNHYGVIAFTASDRGEWQLWEGVRAE